MPHELDHQQLYQKLLRFLTLTGPTSAADASRHLDISQPTFSRLVGQHRDNLLKIGRARSTRYAVVRTIPNVGSSIPIYEVMNSGQVRQFAILHPKQPMGFYLESLTDELTAGFYNDLPYFLRDLKPAGFLGRMIPNRHPELEQPQDIRLWTSDHCLSYLTHWGWNLSGSLIVGQEAYRLYLRNLRTPQEPVRCDQRSIKYPKIANAVLSEATKGCLLCGEQPKFLVTRTPGPIAVLVKFSPTVIDQTTERMADLLVCEHIAHKILNAHHLPAAKSELILSQNRIFLEVKRFDRLEKTGRRGLFSLATFDYEFVGKMRSWTDTAGELLKQGRIEKRTFSQIQWLECFGRLIGNTDMHQYNLSFYCHGVKIADLAPAYDMLPMKYAPQYGQQLNSKHLLEVPQPTESEIWEDVCCAARNFWSAVSSHTNISDNFRRIAALNVAEIDSLTKIRQH